jgi:hypothetical protein
MGRLIAGPVEDGAFDGAEELLERLALADEALENLAHASGRAEEELASAGGGWAARVELDGTELLLRSDGGRWTIYLRRGADDDGAMLAARKLHGLVGAQADGWDLDR